MRRGLAAARSASVFILTLFRGWATVDAMTSGMKEIARLAGVSISTVSRVLSGRTVVAEDTRKRVQAVVDRLGYEAHAFASGLASRRTGNILLVVPNITDDYYPMVVRHVTRACLRRRVRVFLGVSDFDAAAERELLRETRRLSVDGLLVSSLQREENLPVFVDLAHRRFPVVHLDNECFGVRLPTVKYDDREGARRVVRHLVERGHRRIAFLAAASHFQTVQDRLAGYRDALAEAGLPGAGEAAFIRDDGLAAWPFDALAGYLRRRGAATALVAENDLMALACLRRMQAAGLRVPEDVAIAGFDNTCPPHLVEVPLTSVALPVEAACQAAIEMLFRQIEAPERKRAAPEIRVLAPELVIGRTT
jgi:LacI family transcriptional regulator